MTAGEHLDFEIRPNAAPVADADRAAMLANPGFGRVATDHMVTIRYAEGKGWYEPRLEARAPIPMDPATAVLHYAQEIFEGLKAYRMPDGGVSMFRPDANAARFAQSAQRMAMPQLPQADREPGSRAAAGRQRADLATGAQRLDDGRDPGGASPADVPKNRRAGDGPVADVNHRPRGFGGRFVRLGCVQRLHEGSVQQQL